MTFLSGTAMEEGACSLGNFSSGWPLGGASWVSTLPYEQRMSWKRNVLRSDAGKNLGWMVTLTNMYDLGYPVEFPEGKLKPAVLLIHETPDTEMKQYKENDNELLLKAHRVLLNCLKDSKKKYTFASPLLTPAMEVVENMG